MAITTKSKPRQRKFCFPAGLFIRLVKPFKPFKLVRLVILVKTSKTFLNS